MVAQGGQRNKGRMFSVTLSISEGFFAEFTLNEVLRLRFLRMARSEGLRDDMVGF